MEETKNENGNHVYKWTDVICNIALDHFLDATGENWIGDGTG